jgi:hypothetical protein
MRRSDIEILVRSNYLPWVVKLPETRTCLKIVQDRMAPGTLSGCSLLAGWAFTAAPASRSRGGVYCWSHLMMILSAGEEQVRIEDLVKRLGAV